MWYLVSPHYVPGTVLDAHNPSVTKPRFLPSWGSHLDISRQWSCCSASCQPVVKVKTQVPSHVKRTPEEEVGWIPFCQCPSRGLLPGEDPCLHMFRKIYDNKEVETEVAKTSWRSAHQEIVGQEGVARKRAG